MNRTLSAFEERSPGSVLPSGAYRGALLDLTENFSSLPGWDGKSNPEAEAVDAKWDNQMTRADGPGYRWLGRYGWMDPEWGQEGARCGGATVELGEGDNKRVVPLMCGMWSCPVCGYRRYCWFRKQLSNAIKDHRLQYFWTLTIDTKTVPAGDSFLLLKQSWNRFLSALKRKVGPVKFVWVMETTKQGYAHLHVVWDRFVEHRWVSDTWKRVSKGSYIVWVKRVDNAGAASYLAKYLADSEKHAAALAAGDSLKYQHRFGRSKSVEFEPFHKPAKGWEIVRVSFKERLKEALGWSRVLSGSWVGVPVYLEAAQVGRYDRLAKRCGALEIGVDVLDKVGWERLRER